MKIGVIVPSTEYLAQAGVRIRYRRIAPHLAALGHELVIEVIENVRGATDLGCDAYLFSKCYDARAIVLARMMRAAGKLVAIDLFDDMFSQRDDSRFVRHRAWLREIAETIDFGLCSTERMRAILHDYAPALPAHVLNDPFESFDRTHLARRIEQKRREALDGRTLRLLWFGVGDNPHFTVGLADLAAFAPTLQRLRANGFEIELDILTNRRALTERGLRMIRRLGMPHRVEEWTADREIDLLDASLLSFLPVNGQGFSNAKSLNRAVTALTGGTQILSAGYPLYAPLAEFIYRDAGALLADLEADRLRLSGATLDALAERFAGFGDPTREVGKLADFLAGLRPGAAGPPAELAVIHGRKSPVQVHKQVQRLKQLSVGSPYAASGLNFDVRLVPLPGTATIEVLLSERAAARLAAEDAACLVDRPDSARPRALRITAGVQMVDRLAAPVTDGLAGASMNYGRVVADVAAVVHRLLPGTHAILSEAEPPLAAALGSSDAEHVLSVVSEARLERVLFVANAQIPSLQISFVRPLEPLAAEGRLRMMTIADKALRDQFARSPRSRLTRRYVSETLDSFDPTLIVFCRYSGVLSDEIKAFAARRGVPMIFHIDDDLLNIPPEIGKEKYEYHSHPERIAVIRDLLAQADLVYASTANLGALLERDRVGRRVVAGKIYCAAEVRRVPGPRAVRRFGYMGGGDHGYDLDTVVPAVAEVLDRHPRLEFEIFGGIPVPTALERFGERVSHIPPISDYAAFLRHFSTMEWDIGICPLVPNAFNACKANTKWIEYTAVGIAVVATRGMAYDECSADGAGMLAATHDEWVAALDRLVGEDGLCYAQTMRAQAKLRAEYSTAALQRQIADIVAPVLGRPLLPTPTLLAAE